MINIARLNWPTSVQALKEQIANLKSTLSVSSLSKHGFSSELEDLLRTRTELECVIADLEHAGEKGEVRRGGLQEELDDVMSRINDVETELMEAVPDWEDCVKAEKDERSRFVAYFCRHLVLHCH